MDRKLCLREALYFVLIPPMLVVNQESASQTCSQANLMEAVPHLQFPLPRCVQLTTKVIHHSIIDSLWT